MVGFRETLTHEAGELAFAEERRAAALRRKLALHDETGAKLKSDVDHAASAAARIHRYQPVIDETPQCPHCWILRAKKEPLSNQESGGKNDLFKCRECGYEVPLEP
ncbi:hypothetical protein [Mesorhizobium sp. WSM4313]|uniref:hypothetical protein n=1 Tax=Mesorhizobium sp. WSM4313 TaxID=2029412 RepID=UPI000BAF14AB|nr:hypothetical protein [Mesorhizobium sp. WSM4313]PBB21121.1 hypothetical protein CK219_00330 [Mesorhizobium sp. WSM4313]